VTVILKVALNRQAGTASPGLHRTMLSHRRVNPTSPRKRGQVDKAATCRHLSPRAGRGRIALAIRVRGRLRKGHRDRLKNARHVAEHFVIPEPQYPVIVIDKPFVANRIARVVRVLSSINFNDKTTLATDQIDRVRTDRLLPDKFITVETPRPKSIPERSLGMGGVTSQTPRALGAGLVSFPHVETPPHPDCCATRPLPARGERLASPILP
jgi:hypothetical protein